MLYSSLSCENLPSQSQYDLRGVPLHGPLPVYQPGYISDWPPVLSDTRRSHYKPSKYKGMFKRKKNKEVHGGFYDRYVSSGPVTAKFCG